MPTARIVDNLILFGMVREKRRIHCFKKRAGWKDKHHLKPKEKGGQSVDSNIIMLDAYRHSAWHLLFKNKSLDEVIHLLQRLKEAKQSPKDWINSLNKHHKP